MTSINAIRFDPWSGAMLCDEQRHWNTERVKIYAADKIRPVVPEELAVRYRVAAAYGNTGTSGIGDELRLTILKNVSLRYSQMFHTDNQPPETFLTVEDIARLTFDTICNVKHAHVDQGLNSTYGFTTSDIVRGSYCRNGDQYQIADGPVMDDAMLQIAPPADLRAVGPVLGNGGILAGYDDQFGYQIFTFSMRGGYWEPVHSGFACQGSGSDMANIVVSRFFNRVAVDGRQEGVDPVAALIALTEGVFTASRENLGVGGYFNFLLFDGRHENILRQISDHRARLAVETIHAHAAGQIGEDIVYSLFDGLFFHDRDVDWGEALLWQSAADRIMLHRVLRGMPV